MERKIVKVVSFKEVHEDYSYDMDLEYVDHGDGKLRKYYWLADNFNNVKVCVWAGSDTNMTYDEENEYIRNGIKKNITGYAAALEAAAEIINDDDYFDNDENEDEE